MNHARRRPFPGCFRKKSGERLSLERDFYPFHGVLPKLDPLPESSEAPVIRLNLSRIATGEHALGHEVIYAGSKILASGAKVFPRFLIRQGKGLHTLGDFFPAFKPGLLCAFIIADRWFLETPAGLFNLRNRAAQANRGHRSQTPHVVFWKIFKHVFPLLVY
jgi:hypothetical protein